jgi:hypothetical protein
MKTKLAAGLGTFVLIITVWLLLGSQKQQVAATTSVDVSWPNCKVTQPNVPVGIVGVTGGLDFQQNACLRSEVAWFPMAALYMNTGWPGTTFHLQFPDSPRSCALSDTLCLAYNYGFHAAQYAISYANSRLVQSSQWWLDVETENSWTNNVLQNRAALQGMIDAIHQNVFAATVGFYSYPGQWIQIVGNWRPRLPAWVATGTMSESMAVAACHEPSFTGSSVQLSQYTLKLDEDYNCSL